MLSTSPDCVSRDLKSKEKWTSYSMRRGYVDVIISAAPDLVVNQVMWHDPITGC